MMAHDKINFSDSEEESLSSNEESDDEFDPNDSDDYAKMSGFIAKKVPPKSKTPAGRGRGAQCARWDNVVILVQHPFFK